MMILLIDYKMQLISIVVIKFIESTTFGKCVTSIKKFTLLAVGEIAFSPPPALYMPPLRINRFLVCFTVKAGRDGKKISIFRAILQKLS